MPTRIRDLPEDIVRRIFALGVKGPWAVTDEETESIEESDSEEGSVHNADTTSACEVKFLPERETVMCCASVCRNWADIIIDHQFWTSVGLPQTPEYLPHAWEIGIRWNKLFSHVDVAIPCTVWNTKETIARVLQAAKHGRSRFRTVFIVSKEEEKIEFFIAWDALQIHLCLVCSHLTIAAVTTIDEKSLGQHIGVTELIITEWPKLESLELDSHAVAFDLTQEWITEQLRTNRFCETAFPVLKYLHVPAHYGVDSFYKVLNLTPLLEHLYIDASADAQDLLEVWGVFQEEWSTVPILNKDRSFRSYVSPTRMHMFKYPGPSYLKQYETEWIFDATVSDTEDYGILVSERRDGNLCELRLSFEELFAVEDLTKLEIPPRPEYLLD